MFFGPDGNIGTLGRKARGALVLSVLPLVAACSGSGGKAPAETAAAEPAGCPRVTVVRDAAEVTQFREGGGRDMTDVKSRAAVVDFTGGCEYDRNGVTVNLNLVLGAERGPAASHDKSGTYRYFVAITDPAGQIVAKQEFDTTIDFSPNVGRGGSVEELSQQIPLENGASGASYEVLVGFQLAPADLEFNRNPQRTF
jgi:hypothetical protein